MKLWLGILVAASVLSLRLEAADVAKVRSDFAGKSVDIPITFEPPAAKGK